MKSKINKLKGGTFLGQGSFGCVITPEIKCSLDKKVKSKLGVQYDNKTKKVSKIILKRSDDLREELNISKLILTIDPKQEYFITILDYCNLNTVPKARNNVVKVSYLDNKFKSYTSLETKKLSKKYCPIDLNYHPLNVIMPFGGHDLFEIVNFIIKNKPKITYLLKSTANYQNYSKEYNQSLHELLAKEKQLGLTESERKDLNKQIRKKQFIYNKINLSYQILFHFKKWFRHLIMGLLKLHQGNIVNKDIKLENITALYDSNTKKLQVRFIDFGLSQHLTPSYCNDKNIFVAGTYDYIGPEIFIGEYLVYYNNYKTDSYIISAINEQIKENQKKFFKDMEIEIPNMDDIIVAKYQQMKNDLNTNPQILNNKFFGINNNLNGYLQKSDIYALGTTIYEFLFMTNIYNFKKDIRLMDLLKNMYEIDVDKRYNALQCINHPYFNK